MKKGTKTYKCDSCIEKLANKTNLENYLNKEHKPCNLCMKILPTITSLNIHITAVHDKLKTKHQIGKRTQFERKKKVAENIKHKKPKKKRQKT